MLIGYLVAALLFPERF
ncbi:MAG: K(+)-transporting ATPase subunit F [Actinomycetota bacterium]